MLYNEFMYYVYILHSKMSKNFYFGYTNDLKKRIKLHQEGKVKATLPYIPWQLVYYSAFTSKRLAKNFELYLKSGSGKAFAYKRLADSVALKKDK